MNMANDKRIIGIETTFGALREIKVGGSILKCGDNVRFEKFHGEKETLSCWQDYGQYNEDRIHLLQNGDETPIKIGQWEFWPVVKDIHYWQVSTEANNHHRVTLSGRDGNGKLFEETFVIYGEELLPGLVYAMILFSVTNDITLGVEYWKALSGKFSLKYASDGEHLDKVIALKKLSENIVKEHPYMELFLQKGMKEVVERLKESISKLEILK